jgi:exosortase family protein XrtM
MAKRMPDRMANSVGPQWRSAVKFALVFSALHVLYAWGEGTVLERFIIEVVTVRSAAIVIAHIDSASAVLAIGHEIIAPCGSLSIRNGCDGIEAAILLVAAFIAAPVSNGYRMLGIIAALPFVYFVNQVRVVVLFFAYCRARDMFPLLHGYIAPTAIIIACCAFFLLWFEQSATQIYRD